MSSFTSLRILQKVLRSKAPGPRLTFTEVHVLGALELIGKEGSIGRIKLARKLGLGEGATRTLLKHLKENGLIIITPKTGCQLTSPGKKIYDLIKSRVEGPVDLPKTAVTLGTYNVGLLIRNASKAVKHGIEQRDAAIKVGATGATTLVFNLNKFLMPGTDEDCFRDAPEARKQVELTLKPKENDVIVIGSAESRVKAELGAEAAAYETLKQLI